jgi:hypothetical protein
MTVEIVTRRQSPRLEWFGSPRRDESLNAMTTRAETVNADSLMFLKSRTPSVLSPLRR